MGWNYRVMDKIYIIKYCGGDWEYFYTNDVFATTDEQKAIEYVSKFNFILKEWRKYYSQFEDHNGVFNWIKKEHSEKHSKRWHCIKKIDKCYYEQISLR